MYSIFGYGSTFENKIRYSLQIIVMFVELEGLIVRERDRPILLSPKQLIACKTNYRRHDFLNIKTQTCCLSIYTRMYDKDELVIVSKL